MVDGLAQLVAAQGALGVIGIGECLCDLAGFGPVGLDLDLLQPPTSRRQVVLRGIHGDAVEPRVERTLPTESRQRPVSLDESVLGNVLDILRVAYVARDKAVDPMLVTHEEQVECTGVPGLHAANQCLIRVFAQRVAPC